MALAIASALEAAMQLRSTAGHLADHRNYRIHALGLGLLGCVGLAACGGGSDGDDPAPAPPPAVPPLAAPVALVDGAALGTPRWPAGNSAEGGQGQTVEGIECGLMDTTYHIHTHLSIFVDGEMQRIPADVGIVPATGGTAGCVYALHTHDATGKIHVEAAAPQRFTLGQFFAIWGQPLTRTNVAGIDGLPVVVYVSEGGTVTVYGGDDLHEIDLQSHREITIQVGSPVAEIPNYTWDGD
jgi:hypothetical protein